jgi:hypothetical protein
MKEPSKRGGAREGAGRKSKDEELKIIERLDNIIESDDVIKSLKVLIKDGNFNAIKLYLEYRYGKPKETIENINRNFEAGELTKEEVDIIKNSLLNNY